MSKKRLKRQFLKKKLFTKNRLVILNEETFEETFSLRLTLMNVFVVGTLSALIIIILTTFIIAFTPLREYIPGYASTQLKKEATELALKSDSLANALKKNDAYLTAIKRVLTGDLDHAKLSKDSIVAVQNSNPSQASLAPTTRELALREQVRQEDKYNLFEQASRKVDIVFFAPVKGSITEKYDAKNKHYAVDIALPANTPIKAIANGTIIFADWTPTNGNVAILRHNEGFISIYKHCELITKSQGDVVRTNEVIAIAGSSGEQSTGVHLHFELWKDNNPIDPTQFISFE